MAMQVTLELGLEGTACTQTIDLKLLEGRVNANRSVHAGECR